MAVQDAKVSPAKGGRESEDDNECYVEDDHDPCPDYKPLVPLPEKVEVRTGEEDEQVRNRDVECFDVCVFLFEY